MTASRPVEVARETATKSTKRIVQRVFIKALFGYPDCGFIVTFLSRKANAGV
jgi:hypothetical protein